MLIDTGMPERRGAVVWTMKMPKTCIECPLQFGGLCMVVPPDLDDGQVAPTVDECKGRTEWCPLEYAEDVYMRHYRQGRKDERAIMEGRLIQSFSPD